MRIITIPTANNRTLIVSNEITSQKLNEILGLQSVVLGHATHLKNGETLRSFRPVSARDEKVIDLAAYDAIFLSDYSWFGWIKDDATRHTCTQHTDGCVMRQSRQSKEADPLEEEEQRKLLVVACKIARDLYRGQGVAIDPLGLRDGLLAYGVMVKD